MKENALVIYSRSIGDTLCSTPTLRKLYKTFNSKFNVVTHVPEIFERSPYVLNTYKFEDFNETSLQKKFNVFKVFHNMSHKNLEGIEWKYGLISLQQSMAMDLGFMLLPEELSCDFYPRPNSKIPELPKDYICIHPVQSWPSRTWPQKMWEQLIEEAFKMGMPIVSTGKDSSEKGFFNIDKPAYTMLHKNNIDLINKLGLSETWNIINNSKIFITMDTGLLHLAGTTNTHIIQLGSSIHPYYRAPYRNGSQQYKYSYIKGSCNSFCASDMKYSLKEWGNIQAVPPLLGCLEGRKSFDCHPNFSQVFDECKNILNGNKVQSISVPVDIQISEVAVTSEITSKESMIEFTGFKNGKYFHFVYTGKEELSVICLMSDNITNLSYYKTEMILHPNIEHFFGIGDDGTPGTKFEIFDKLTMELIYKYVDPYILTLDKIFYNLACNNSTATAYPLKEIFTNKEYDSEFVNITEGDVVVDLGANVGLFALYSLTKKCKKCYSVEPHPETFKYLKINTSDRFDNVITINKAISTIDNMYMDLNSQNSTGLSIYNNPKEYSVKVDSIFLDQLIEEYNINMIDYLKIDIEGAEYDLLRNIDKKYLSNNVKKIALELHRCSDEDFNFIKLLLTECSFNYIIIRSNDIGTNKMIHAWKKEKIDKITLSTIDFLGFNKDAQKMGSIQTVPLITGCLENKSIFECNSSSLQVVNEIKSILNIMQKKEEMKKIIIISPHLSTGGLPSYLLKQVETLKDIFDVYVVEYEDLTAGVFVVQKNKIISILEDEHFITLCKNKFELLNIIHKIHPDIIHFEEFPELFMDKVIARSIYSKAERYYTIVETTHNSAFKDTDKIFLPDKFCFVSNDSVNKFSTLDVPSELVEYPIEIKIKKDKAELFKILNLDPEYKHVLNVGLFTPGKNQKEIFDYAKELKNYKIKFHFVGNQAGNFKEYWEPLMRDKPDNCIIWGERNDVDLFYDACDLFLFTSISELNPVVLKEALSWKLPILMYNLPIYNDMYDNMRGIFYLTKERNKNISIIKNKLNIFEKDKNQYNIKLVHLLTYPNEDIEIQSMESMSKLSDFGINYMLHINPVPTELTNLPAKYPTSQDGTVLLPGHYGCFHAFQRAIETEFTPDVDFFMICERDCVMTISVQEFYDNMMEILPIILKEDISYFSFGDTFDLEFRVLQSIIKRKLEYTNLLFITNKIIGLQCILFPKSSRSFLLDMFKNVPWYAMDTWFNEVFLNEYLPIGIVTERMTTQLNGYSLIENRNKEFK